MSYTGEQDLKWQVLGKKSKPEIVIDFIKTIATSLTLHTVNIIPYSMIRSTKLCIQKDYSMVITIIIVEC